MRGFWWCLIVGHKPTFCYGVNLPMPEGAPPYIIYVSGCQRCNAIIRLDPIPDPADR